ncbi:hypothetical protein ACH5RR_021039 [Cinchona calisaya]|uniref:C2H2-type domain-containing protein n=1 Tax=Cinchona calisaya TaxID=153742 RepID=A0ABD2ZG54_9GENT
MEFMEASEEFSGSNDQSIIIKGKRTKRRQRPLSPVGRVTSSSSSGGDGEVSPAYVYSLIPSSSSSDITTSVTTSHPDQEDEDMANCLILLAQGETCTKQKLVLDDHDEEEIIKREKFSSRRFNEMVTTTNSGGKVGFFVYECKTCNRTFPSFQALGGHRTSHKKLKIINVEDNNKATILATSTTPFSNDHHHQEEEQEEKEEEKATISINQSANKSCISNKGSKIHECSICGAEFGSGQALGGHMRRHRNPSTTITSKVSVILETSPSSNLANHDVEKSRNIFPLDLNLPAPSSEDDDLQRDLKFQFSANQQQPQHLVFSAPALVDCHY